MEPWPEAMEREARTHLTTIKLAAQMLERQDESTVRQRRQAHEISRAADRLCTLLEQSAAQLRDSVRGKAQAETLLPSADEALERSARVREELQRLHDSL